MVDLDFEAAHAEQAANCVGNDDDFCVVTVRATDASGDATATSADTNVFVDATVTIKITDVDEKPMFVTDTDGDLTRGFTEDNNARRGYDCAG